MFFFYHTFKRILDGSGSGGRSDGRNGSGSDGRGGGNLGGSGNGNLGGGGNGSGNGSGGSDIYKTSKSVQLARQMAGGRDWICKIDSSKTNQPYWFNTQDRRPQFSPPPGWNTPITIHGGSANEAQEVTAVELSGFERASSFDVAERPRHGILAGSQFVQSNQHTSSGNRQEWSLLDRRCTGFRPD